jgi:hypothetical protein
MSCPPRRVQRTFPPVATGPIASPPTCSHEDQIGTIRLRSYQDRRNTPGARFLRPNRAPYAASSGRHLRSCRDDAMPPACVYSGQIRALMPHQADFIFGHIGTDATPPACIYSGQIGALTPHQADFIFGHIGTDAMPLACVYLGQIRALAPH